MNIVANEKKKNKLLIVDDEAEIRELLADFFESEDFECLKAGNATEALEIFANNFKDIDLVLSDIRMPGKSGLDLLEDIKKIDDDAIVVMISALKDIESAIAAMSRGAYDYASKPFKLNEVYQIVKKGIEKRQLLIENKNYQKKLEEMVELRTRELQNALQELDNTYSATLIALVNALDTRDSETQGHSLRVVHYSLKIARLLGINEQNELKNLEFGSLLHDIGKIGIPDNILRKPGKLDEEEWRIMKIHPVLGFNIIKPVKFLKNASKLILYHHEQFDGSGYPEGLKGNQIPLGARIFTLADTIDAMTSDRPYRKALTFEATAKEIERCNGKQFDPEIVEAFFKLSVEQWQKEKDDFDRNNLKKLEIKK